MRWSELSRFWHPGYWDLPPIAMLKLYCDESDDGHTYALAGWFGTPSCWDRFDPKWRAMLASLLMPDGSACKAFHASDIELRDQISDSKFKGWTRAQAVEAFTKATDLIVDTKLCALLWPLGCAVELPNSVDWIKRDSVWLVLFFKFFQIIADHYPAQMGISLMFDNKDDAMEDAARRGYREARKIFERIRPGKFDETIAFGCDENNTPLQAADFFAYEWRKSITDGRLKPNKPPRTSYSRIRSVRKDAALWRYGREVYDEAVQTEDVGMSWLRFCLERPPTVKD